MPPVALRKPAASAELKGGKELRKKKVGGRKGERRGRAGQQKGWVRWGGGGGKGE